MKKVKEKKGVDMDCRSGMNGFHSRQLVEVQ